MAPVLRVEFPNDMACGCVPLGKRLTLSAAPQKQVTKAATQKEVTKAASNDFALPLSDENTVLTDPGSLTPFAPIAIDVKPGTPLYSAIESEKWENAVLFLETGSFGWGESALSLFGWGEQEPPQNPQSQARTWVVGSDWWGKVVSQSLPIHAAVVKKAPITLIQKLIEIYPESIRCKDLDGNLPLHLSFKHNSPDGVVAFLLKSYPEAVNEKNYDGRQPVDYASADACEIIQVCVEQTNKVAEREEAKLCQALETEKTRLTEILSELSEIRGELDHLRKSKPNQPATEAVDEKEELVDKQEVVAGGKSASSCETSLNVVTKAPKKQKSDRKLRFPWSRKKVHAA